MILEKILCETCGGQLELPEDASITARCLVCGNTYIVKGSGAQNKKAANAALPSQRQTDEKTKCSEQFFYFCNNNKLSEAKNYWNENKSFIDIGFTVLGNTALTISAYKGYKEIVKWLIEAGCPLDQRNDAQQTALIRAAIKGDKEIAEILLKAGADIDAIDKDNCTALSYAVDSSSSVHKEISFLLLENKANPNIGFKYGKPDLIAAIRRKNKPLVEALLNAGADINCTDKDENPAIFIALIAGGKDILFLLIEKGADTSVTDKKGETFFELAARYKILDEVNI